jgi:hypothetical protein
MLAGLATLLLSACSLIADDGSSAPSQAATPGNTLTIGGKTFVNAVVTTNAAGIAVRHDKGIFSLDFLEMTDEDQARFGYDPAADPRQTPSRPEETQGLEDSRRQAAAARMIIRAAEQRGIAVELNIRKRRGPYAIADGFTQESRMATSERQITIERLKGPGMKNRDETVTRTETHPVIEKTALDLVVLDAEKDLAPGTPWKGMLYPAGLDYLGRPVFVRNAALIPAFRQGGYPPMPAMAAYRTGLLHGITLPVRYYGLMDYALLPKPQRNTAYWGGVATSVYGALGLIIILLVKRKRKPVPVPQRQFNLPT